MLTTFLRGILAAASCPGPSPGRVFVSPNGSDANTGCSASVPILTIERAQAVARATRRSLDVVVIQIDEGVYELAAPLRLNGEFDSSTQWTAAPGTRPIISAGRRVKRWRDEGGGLFSSDLRTLLESTTSPSAHLALGELSPRGWASPYRWQSCEDYDVEYCAFVGNDGSRFASALELFASGAAQNLAAWPNTDFLKHSATTPGSPFRPWLNGSLAWGGGRTNAAGRRGLRLSSARPNTKRWSKMNRGNQMWIHIGEEWKDAHCPLDETNAIGAPDDNASSTTLWLSNAPDATTHSLSCTGDDQTLDASRPLGSEPDTPPRIYIYNVLAELDVEGEYFVDRNSANWTVWWRPPGGNVSSSNAAYVSLLQNVVSMENVTDVALVGLSLRHARGDGVAIVGCANVSIRRSEIIGHGNLGVNMTNCSDSSVVDSVIAETGDGGVWLQGGDRASLTKSNLTLVGCNLSTFNRWDRTYRPGVSLLGCGARVERCTFTRSPHQCVMIVGNEHSVLDSTFTASLFESSDSGAVYSEQDWTFRGNRIVGSTFKDLHSLYYPRMLWAYPSHPRAGGWWGDWVKAVHLDNQVGGFLVANNTFIDVSYAFDINGGSGHVIVNNTFGSCPVVNCTTLISMHACSGGSLPCPPLSTYSPYTVQTALPRVPWNGSVWRAAYPLLIKMIEEELYCVPYANTISYNSYDNATCINFPVRRDRASAAELVAWGFTGVGNTNTRACPPLA